MNEFWKDRETQIKLAVVLLPLIWFASLIRVKFTYGDGPELVMAAYLLGGPHPSGYPLFTMLAHIPSQLPIISPFYNVAFMLSALPTALTAGVMYTLGRELGVRQAFSAVLSLVWVFGATVAYLATRVEVYAIHGLFVSLALLWLLRYQTTKDIKQARLAVLFVCLGLTNHLTTALLIIPVVVGLLVTDYKAILKPKNVAIFLGIAAACASVYLYLPWQAMANEGDRISWNDPQTFERFWFHVTGQEYSIFRGTSKIAKNMNDFVRNTENAYFPGIFVMAVLGAIEMAFKRWRFLVVLVIGFVSYLVYVATYTINDISTYYTTMHLLVILGAGVGIEWLVKQRFTEKQQYMVHGLILGCLVWIGALMWRSSVNQWREALAEDMSSQVIADMQDPSIIFTSVDGHSFPMWYQRFVNHPEREQMLPIDTVMFGLANKTWYRDWFRDHFDWVKWPDEEVVASRRWQQWLIENNPDINFYVMLNGSYNVGGSFAVNRGWHFEVVRGRPDARAQRHGVHIYSARFKRFRSGTYFYDSSYEYEGGKDKIACVAEWRNNPQMNGTWKFFGPNNEEVVIPNHALPPKTDMSWEFLEIDQQTPGNWRCEVIVPGQPTMVTHFTVK